MATHKFVFQLVGPEKNRTHASVGSDVTVPCLLSPKVSAIDMEIRWFKDTDCVCHYMNREVIEGRGYEGRVSLRKDRGNVSIRLREFRESDIGDYLCRVTNGDRTEEITVRLRVADLDTKSPTGFPGLKIDLARGALGIHNICIEKINRAWTEKERRAMKDSMLLAVQFKGMNFRQVVEFLRHENEMENRQIHKPLQKRELRLILLGQTGSSKSAVGNMILGRKDRIPTSSSTESQQSESRQGEVAGRKVTVVETPDWFCSGLSLKELRQDVELCVRLSAPGPHAFLLVIPVKESAGEMLGKMEEIFGERCWTNTIILFTVTDEQQVKNKLEFFQSGNLEVQRLVEKCENRFHCLNINQSGDDAQVSQLLEKIEKMMGGNTERFYSSEIYLQIQKTEEKIVRETEKFKERHEREIREKLSREMEEAFHRFTDKIRSLEEHLCKTEKKIQELKRKIKEGKDEAEIKELKRKLEIEKKQKQMAEDKVVEFREKWQKERSDMEKRHREEVEKIKEMCKQDIMMKVEKRVTKIILSELWTHIAEYKEKMDEKDREIKALKQKNLPAPVNRRISMDEPITMKASTENQFSFGRWILVDCIMTFVVPLFVFLFYIEIDKFYD